MVVLNMSYELPQEWSWPMVETDNVVPTESNPFEHVDKIK